MPRRPRQCRDRQTFQDCTVTQLKAELRQRGLPLGGRKADLLLRLLQHINLPQNNQNDNIQHNGRNVRCSTTRSRGGINLTDLRRLCRRRGMNNWRRATRQQLCNFLRGPVNGRPPRPPAPPQQPPRPPRPPRPPAPPQEEEECAICLDEIQRRGRCQLENCRHVFHRKCINDWIRQNNDNPSCPMCNAEIQVSRRRAVCRRR